MEFVNFSAELFEDWDSVVYHSPDGWAFSLSCWLQMVTRVWGMENCSFAVRENGKLVAAMPLHWIPLERRLSSGGWGFGGPIIISHVSKADRLRLWRACWKQVESTAKERGADRVTASISPIAQSSLNNHWGVNPLIEASFQDVSTHTRIINLNQDENALWLGLAKDARQKIKQARAAGYSVRRCSWKEMIDEYYRVHCENYLRTGVRPHPRAYFEGIADQPAKHHVLWVGFDPEGSPVAFHNDARFGNSAVYHTGCSETAHLTSGINYLLFWEAVLGEKLDKLAWYETGEVFPQAQMGKEKGLTDFKGKFGGELHRVFRGEIVLERQPLVEPALSKIQTELADLTFRQLVYAWFVASRDLMESVLGKGVTRKIQSIFFKLLNLVKREKQLSNTFPVEDKANIKDEQKLANDTRSLFSNDGVYKAETISRPIPLNPRNYTEILLQRCIKLVRRYVDQANVLDVCCANGHHLIGFSEMMKSGVGLDFSKPYIQKANENKTASDIQNINFVCNDAKKMSIRANYFDLAYSFSSLYIIPDVGEVVHEVARTLKPGGKCVLDFGNHYSLNSIVANAYHRELGWARTFSISVPRMKRIILESGLKIIEHRSFQILPLWGADRPKWLAIFLLPIWTKLLAMQINGTMIDEWISSLPILKFFAFRHLFVCEKR